MNEKRFHKDMLNIVDVLTNRAYTFEFEEDLDEIVDLLNSFTEENEQLKQEIIVYKKAFQEQVQRCSL